MNPLSIILGILGLIITVLIAMIPYFRRVYFIGPELTIELVPDGGSSTNKGLSGKNHTAKGYVDGNNAIYVFEVTWKVNLKIINNSNITAYYPKLNYLNQQLSFSRLETLDSNKPIQGNEQILSVGKYVMSEEVNGNERTQINGLPDNFDDLKILLEYKNPNKKRFYTVFSNSNHTEKNVYTRKKPTEFK
jgi:hypothetical protein